MSTHSGRTSPAAGALDGIAVPRFPGHAGAHAGAARSNIHISAPQSNFRVGELLPWFHAPGTSIRSKISKSQKIILTRLLGLPTAHSLLPAVRMRVCSSPAAPIACRGRRRDRRRRQSRSHDLQSAWAAPTNAPTRARPKWPAGDGNSRNRDFHCLSAAVLEPCTLVTRVGGDWDRFREK